MRRTFRAGYLEEYRLLEPRILRYRAEDLGRLIDFLPRLRFFAGHCISADLPYDHAAAEVVGLAAVRDPVERILSWYAFNRNTHQFALIEKTQDLASYLASAVRDYDFEADPWRFCQVPDLVDLAGAPGLERVRELAASGRLLLFPLGRFDEMLCYLERVWPEEFDDLAYASRENLSSYDQPLTAEIRASLDRLAALSPLRDDFELLRFADAELTRRIAELPEGPSGFAHRLQKFRDRCRRARKTERWVRGPLKRVRDLWRTTTASAT